MNLGALLPRLPEGPVDSTGTGKGFLRCGTNGGVLLKNALRLGELVPNSVRIGVEGIEAGGCGNCERRKDSPLLIVLSARPEIVVSCERAETCFDMKGDGGWPWSLDGYIADGHQCQI